jgi:hypothetical protein
MFAGFMALGIVATVAQAAEPPPYKEMPVDPPNYRGWNKARNCPQSSDPKAMLRGDADWNAAAFDPFFINILFPQFTLYHETDANGKEIGSNVLPVVEDPHDKKVKWRTSMLPTCRQEFIKMFINQGERNPNQEPFNHLNAVTIQAMRTIALENYHPLSRYNAALLLSSLHEANSDKPLKATMPALMACIESPDSTDLVKVGALDGLLKHAKAGSEGALRPQLIDAMLKIVKEKTPPAGRTPDGHDWIRRRAIDVLAALGDAGPKLTVVAALDAILKDNQSSPELSCSAAKAMGNISFHAPDSMNPSATAYSIGQVAVDAYKAELARAEERKEAAIEPGNNNRGPAGLAPPVAGLGGGLGGARPAAAGGLGIAGAVNHELFVSMPLLRSQLFALDRGLKGPQAGLAVGFGGNPAGAGAANLGLIAATDGKNRQFAESVEKNLALLMAACDPTAADYATLKAQISTAGAGLEAALAGGSGAQGRTPALDKGAGASKDDSFDSEPAKPAAAPATVTPPAKAAPAK